jgi:hypothetical protein
MITERFKPVHLTSAKISDDRILIWWMVFLIIARLWLVEAQDFLATYTPHDDYLFIKLAQHILSGAWLGPYNQVTLVKGPVYPLFIAAAHHTGLPLLLVQHLLYSSVCVLSVVAVRPLLKARWVFMAIFFLLLLNPFGYAYPGTGRAFRFGLSMPLVLAVFACMGGLLLRASCSSRSKILWSVIVGLSFSLLWYTREEGIWLLPSLGLFALYFLVINNEMSWGNMLKRLAFLLPIPIIFTIFTTTFTSLNQKHYGVSCIVELKTPEFQSALGGLININVKKSERYIPVGRESQNAAYAVSPTFKQLKPYFEEGKKGAQMPHSYYIWVLRDMVRKSGNANSLPEALAFYRKVGEEISAACNAGTIPCLDRNPSIKPVWRAEYLKIIPRTFWGILKYTMTFRSFATDEDEYLKWKSTANEKMTRDYQFVTREKIIPGSLTQIQAYPDYYMHMIIEKFRILTDIGAGYKAVIPFLFSLALLVHLVLLGQSIIRWEIDFGAMFGLIILGGIISLVSVLTYVRITLWSVHRPLFSAYPLVLFYISVMSVFVCCKLKRNGSVSEES